MNREYQLVIDFQANEYDMSQDAERMLEFMHIIMRRYAAEDTQVAMQLKEGAEV